jgi:hypothetical protein
VLEVRRLGGGERGARLELPNVPADGTEHRTEDGQRNPEDHCFPAEAEQLPAHLLGIEEDGRDQVQEPQTPREQDEQRKVHPQELALDVLQHCHVARHVSNSLARIFSVNRKRAERYDALSIEPTA